MSNLKYRVALIVALVVASAWALFPRETIERVRQSDGTFAYKTVKRVPLKRGLDLQGGMHLALEVDESRGAVANKTEALDRALTVVRKRVDEFGVSEPVVQKVGSDRIIVELPGIDDPQRAQEVVQKSAFLQFQITDKTQALERVLPRLDALVREKGLTTVAPEAPSAKPGTPADKGITSLFTQGDSTAKTAGAAGPQGADSSKALAGDSAGAPGAFSKAIQVGRLPGQYYVARSDVDRLKAYLSHPDVRAALPPGKVVRWGTDSASLGGQFYVPLYLLDARPIITGEYLQDAKPNTSPQEGALVEFKLNNEGGRRFRNETAKHIKDNMAIVLDDRVITAPVIQSAIGSSGQITLGSNDLQEAQDLALVLRAGALPAPLKVAEVRTIGASLGQDSIHKGAVAGIIAVGLIVVIMVGYYRFSGMLAVLSLVLYVLYTLAVLAGFDAVLTLPGIAGLVLSVGIAVDANVLIFERIREELDRGKTVRTAIDEGFRHALSAIIDTSLTTILTAAVLYQYGTGPVRGFAVTLIAGITASLFTAIFVTRTFYLVWLNRTRGTQTLSI
jgi:preprotein translocase subunit SecD